MISLPTLKYESNDNINLNSGRYYRLSFINKRKYLLFTFLSAVIFVYIAIMKMDMNFEKTYKMSSENILDGCRYVYIDMGTNIGIQIRKVYEPHLYPKAYVLPLFKEIFGNHSNEVCSIGFEANPLHDKYLKEFESYCLKRNWRVKIFTSTAVGIADKNVTFFIEPGNEGNNQWGASLIADSKKTSVTVPSIDIVSWFKKTVLTRRIPPGLDSPRIMMKSDIEGYDQTVISNLVFSGIYCSIDLLYGEHLSGEFQTALPLLTKLSNSCKTKLIYMDDETYYTSRFPFIISNSTN